MMNRVISAFFRFWSVLFLLGFFFRFVIELCQINRSASTLMFITTLGLIVSLLWVLVMAD